MFDFFYNVGNYRFLDYNTLENDVSFRGILNLQILFLLNKLNTKTPILKPNPYTKKTKDGPSEYNGPDLTGIITTEQRRGTF